MELDVSEMVVSSPEAPSGRRPFDDRHIHGDLKVEGVLRLGDDTTCGGDVIARAGVVLGRNVTILGDLITDGSIEMGSGCRIGGHVNPRTGPSQTPDPASSQAAAPAESPTPAMDVEERLGEVPGRDTSTDLHYSAIGTTLKILMELAREHHADGAKVSIGPAPPDGRQRLVVRWGLRPDALQEVVDGLVDLVDLVYFPERGDHATWTNDEILDVLLQRVLTLVTPATVRRTSDTRATVTVQRPVELLGSHGTSNGWPRPVVATLELVGQAVHPSFRLLLDPSVPEDELLGPDADPASIELVVELADGPS